MEADLPRWKRYYDANRERVKERNRARYYTKKGLEVPPRKTPRVPAPKPEIGAENVKRIEELIEELRGLIPSAMRKSKYKL